MHLNIVLNYCLCETNSTTFAETYRATKLCENVLHFKFENHGNYTLRVVLRERQVFG